MFASLLSTLVSLLFLSFFYSSLLLNCNTNLFSCVQYFQQVSKVNTRRIPGDKCNIIRDTHAWGEMRGLCDDEFSIFSTQVVC